MAQYLTQAYRQKPWRTQVQFIGFFLLGLMIVALVAGLYLAITAQTATAGITYQITEEEKTQIGFDIASLRSQIALLTSSNVMQKRAEEMGFKPVDQENIYYMVVPRYTGKQTVIMAPPPGPSMFTQSAIKPTYTLSLWEVLYDGIIMMKQDYLSGNQ